MIARRMHFFIGHKIRERLHATTVTDVGTALITHAYLSPDSAPL